MFVDVANAHAIINVLMQNKVFERELIDLNWRNCDNAAPDEIVAGVLFDLVHEDITEDSAYDLLKYVGIDMNGINLDTLVMLFDNALTKYNVRRKS